MLSYTTRYILKNGGLMMQRKFLGIWWDYQLFSNKEMAVQEKLNKLLHDAEAEVNKLNALQEERYRLLQEIKGSKTDMTQEVKVKMKMRPLRHKAKTLVDNSWTELVKLLSGGRSMAEQVSGIPGARLTEVNGYSVGQRVSEDLDDEFVGAKDFPIRPESRNQQRKKGGNNNQQPNN